MHQAFPATETPCALSGVGCFSTASALLTLRFLERSEGLQRQQQQQRQLLLLTARKHGPAGQMFDHPLCDASAAWFLLPRRFLLVNRCKTQLIPSSS
jgi:hypothetical protein